MLPLQQLLLHLPKGQRGLVRQDLTLLTLSQAPLGFPRLFLLIALKFEYRQFESVEV